MNLAQLKSKRAAMLQALEAMHRKSEFDDSPDRILNFQKVKEDIALLDAQIKKTEDAERRAKLAVPVAYDPSTATTRRPMNLRSFKDYTDSHGITVRADEQAYSVGKFIAASLFDHQPSREWCRNHGIAVKAQIEGTNAAGGALVPDQWANTIINLKEAFGVAARECSKVRMTRDSIDWPRRTGGVSAFFISEGGTPLESTANFDTVKLSAKKMAALVRLSTELAEDAVISVADYLTQEIAYAFASKEDDCLFLGDGTQTYGGMTGLKTSFATNTKGVSTATGHFGRSGLRLSRKADCDLAEAPRADGLGDRNHRRLLRRHEQSRCLRRQATDGHQAQRRKVLRH
jgi:HK97 family phage major capsid protein